MKHISIILLLSGIALSFPAFANDPTIFTCKNFKAFPEIKEKITSLDNKFEWNNPDCKIIPTKTLMAREYQDGKFQFEKGLQVFVYQHYQLKFICLPGWVCKPW